MRLVIIEKFRALRSPRSLFVGWALSQGGNPRKPALTRQMLRMGSEILAAFRALVMELTLPCNGNPLKRALKRLMLNMGGRIFAPRPAPVIEVWHGLRHRCGHFGAIQSDFNVTGHVHSYYPLQQLTCRVNGGAPWPLRFQQFRRIVKYGDFNADIPIATLAPGENNVVLTATDAAGGSASAEVIVSRSCQGSYPLPATVRWGAGSDLEDFGQCTDGKWTIGPDGLRTVKVGYDRIFMIGNMMWRDYEVTAPVTIHDISARNGSQSGRVKHVGFCLRWAGHSTGNNRTGDQPRWGLYPRGGVVWLTVANGRLPLVRQFHPGDSENSQTFDPFPVRFGEPFWMKGSCVTLGPETTRYGLKVWPIETDEPVDWDFQVVQNSGVALRSGGLALVAHEMDVTFGSIYVTDLLRPEATPPPPPHLDRPCS